MIELVVVTWSFLELFIVTCSCLESDVFCPAPFLFVWGIGWRILYMVYFSSERGTEELLLAEFESE